MSDADRAATQNIVLLCSTCHTVIDQAEGDYPAELLRGWKYTHRSKVEQALGIGSYSNRSEAAAVIDPLRMLNRSIFDNYGPQSDNATNPFGEKARLWRQKVVETVIPNNRAILQLLANNQALLTESEKEVAALFEQHVLDLERRHLGDGLAHGGARYPEAMNDIFCDETAP